MRTINEKISILNELKLKIDKITKTKNEKKNITRTKHEKELTYMKQKYI